jgi:Formyl transferase
MSHGGGLSAVQPKSVLICHHDEPLNRFGLARWMASFSDLAAIVVIREPGARLKKRIRREVQRIGLFRFLDVLAFRCYYKFALAKSDDAHEQATLDGLMKRYPDISATCRVLETPSPNSAEVLALLREVNPNVIVARCKSILKEDIFHTAQEGTFVMHPGICPEYRNAHGCFWALAEDDVDNVGMTLLRIDAGVDTGPVYGYYRYNYDEVCESHIVIQSRVVFDNLHSLREKFGEIFAGTARTIDTKGRKSTAWGQPWMTRYLRWKRAARRRAKSR